MLREDEHPNTFRAPRLDCIADHGMLYATDNVTLWWDAYKQTWLMVTYLVQGELFSDT